MIKFYLEIPELPPTDNHLFGQKGKMRFMYKEAKDWKEMVQALSKESFVGDPLETKLFADVMVFVKRDRDLQGGLKLLFDSLQDIVYKNDSQLYEIKLIKFKSDETKIRITVGEL